MPKTGKQLGKASISRLIRMAMLLTSTEGCATKELTRELGVSWHTVHRDREYLKSRLGLDVTYNPRTLEWHATPEAVKRVQPIVKALAVFVGGDK